MMINTLAIRIVASIGSNATSNMIPIGNRIKANRRNFPFSLSSLSSDFKVTLTNIIPVKKKITSEHENIELVNAPAY